MAEPETNAVAPAEDTEATVSGKEAEATVFSKHVDQTTTDQPNVDEAVQPPTVREIFSVPDKPSDSIDNGWQEFQQKLRDEAKGIKWTAAMPDLAAKICELLDIKLHYILLTAWKKVEALRQVLEDSKKTPDKSIYLDLAEHSVDYETRPFIDVKLKGASVKKLTLHVAMNLKLKGFSLKVQNGAIQEIQTGRCEAKGTLNYEKMTIAEKKFEAIKFPLSIHVPSLLGMIDGNGDGTVSPKGQVPTRQDAHEAESKPKQVERIEL